MMLTLDEIQIGHSADAVTRRIARCVRGLALAGWVAGNALPVPAFAAGSDAQATQAAQAQVNATQNVGGDKKLYRATPGANAARAKNPATAAVIVSKPGLAPQKISPYARVKLQRGQQGGVSASPTAALSVKGSHRTNGQGQQER